jgi:hypothetical protein
MDVDCVAAMGWPEAALRAVFVLALVALIIGDYARVDTRGLKSAEQDGRL